MVIETIYPSSNSNEHPLKTLIRCGGYYECPKDPSGKRLGPLAGYAGRYGPDNKQYVGDIYVNFAKAEKHGAVLEWFAQLLNEKIDSISLQAEATGFCGAPEGGKALAVALACESGEQYIFPEKKVTALATGNEREQSVMVFDRHDPKPGSRWWLVEDVINNMSTPKALDALMKTHGAQFVGIVCFLNRSTYDDFYVLENGQQLPIVSLARVKMQQYEQEDPAVASDIAAGNVVWKPKNDWGKFEAAMAKR